MTFSIYPDTLGSPADWSETQTEVAVKEGIFNVLLGAVDTIPQAVFDGNVKYLGVQVESDPEMRPLKPMVSVAYAYRAAAVDGGGGGGNWTVVDSVLYTNNYWGIARGGAGNVFLGDSANTMVNLGVTSTTGSSDFPYMYATVSGGKDNRAYRQSSTVGGGEGNEARAPYAGAFSGRFNIAGGEYDTACFVGGGYSNLASGQYATICGGHNNSAEGLYNTVTGGYQNHAYSNTGATVSGGWWNVTRGDYSAIPGGYLDTLTNLADYSMAFGKLVYINDSYRVAFFDGAHPGRLGINHDDREGGIDYPIHVGTTFTNGNGARLTSGGTWTDASSRAFKENGQPLDGGELLEKISSLAVEPWQYKGSDERHIWPYAEDFVEAFDVGTLREDGSRENQYLASGDVAGVALAGVKELAQQNQELMQIIEELKESNVLLEARVVELEKTG